MHTSKIYLKKFISRGGNREKATSSIDVAKKWLQNKEDVEILFTEYAKETLSAQVKRIFCLGKTVIIFSDYPFPLKIIGIDDRVRKIFSPKFYHVTKREYISLDSAKEYVKNGETVIAITDKFQTSPIVQFENDNRFITESYSIYSICCKIRR